MRIRTSLQGLIGLILLGASLAAAAAPAADPPATVLETLVVTGRVPGPGLWQVRRGEHVMWLLGALTPLPRRMEWTTDEVEARVAGSQALLLPPNMKLKVEGAALGGLFLIPSLLKARNNPDGDTLADVLPAADLARWAQLKARHLGRDRGVEKRRPIVAAAELYEEALEDSDLSQRNVAVEVARRAAKRHDVPIDAPQIELVIPDAKQALREFRATALDDLECFRRTLDKVEHDLESMKLRANAWALGELEVLRTLPWTDNFRACSEAIFESRLARENGLNDLEARFAATWMEAADAALQRNDSTFAVLPLSLMLREDGFLDRLRARGYEIVWPTAGAPAEPSAITP